MARGTRPASASSDRASWTGRALPASARRARSARGLVVSALGFGGAPLGDLYARLDDASAIATVEAALDAGVTLVDTSPLYGRGLSEHRIGTVLRRRPRDARRALDQGRPRRSRPRRTASRDAEGYVGGLPLRGSLRLLVRRRDALARAVDAAARRRVDRHRADPRRRSLDARRGRARRASDEALDGAYARARPTCAPRASSARSASASTTPTSASASRARPTSTACCSPAATRCSSSRRWTASCRSRRRAGIGVMLGGVFNSGILATGAIAGRALQLPRRAARDVLRPRRARSSASARRTASRCRTRRWRSRSAIRRCRASCSARCRPTRCRATPALFARPVPAALWRDLKAERLLRDDAPVPA